MEFFNYITSNYQELLNLLIEHIKLTGLSIFIAILIGIPIGILISYKQKLSKPILGIASVIQAIPSMALLGFAIPFLGIGSLPAIVMVILYSLLPIIKNTYTGIKSINEQMLEAATGIGLTPWQVLTKIQIPLALPVIMAGIRISAVSAVGLMTLAAFVGAGGLGYLVYAGIRSVNNAQILAGAIPACILALLIDYALGIIESLVTPQKSKKEKKKPFWKRPLTQGIILSFIVVVFLGFFLSNYTINKKNERTITIGSMDFTEQEILSYMIKYLVEDNTNIHVNQKLSLGSSSIVLEAIKKNSIDMYVDYTGTIYGSFLKHQPISDANKVYRISKEEFKEKYNLNILHDLNFNNTYTLAIRKDLANQYNIRSISDLANISSKLTFSPTLTFMERNDCYLGLKKSYPLHFKKVIAIDGAPRYTALMNKESDVVDAFSTDALIKKFDLVVLDDDKNFFLPYQAVPVVNDNILKNYPEVKITLEALSPYLSDEVMRELNYNVDVLNQKPSNVAKGFLKKNGLID